LSLLSKGEFTPYQIHRILGINYNKTMEYLEVFIEYELVKCEKKTRKYSSSHREKRPFLRLAPDIPLFERGYYTSFVYSTTEKGLKVVAAWKIIDIQLNQIVWQLK